MLLSVLVAMIGSFTALTHAQRMRESSGRAAMLWMVAGSITLGMAIWSMHFIGMLAFHLPIPLAYDPALTILSVVPAIAATLLGFRVLRESRISTRRLFVSGLLMGAGISVMHYTGMTALRMSPPIGYDPLIVIVSVAVAVIASWGALLMMYQGERLRLAPWPRFAFGAVIMGSAVSGMHYTAMLGTQIQPGSLCLAGTARIEPDILALLVALTSLFWFGGGILATLFDQRMARQNTRALAELEQAHAQLQQRAAEQAEAMTQSLRESEERLRMTLRCAPDAVFICEQDGRIVYVNDNVVDMLGYSRDELYVMTVFDLVPADWHERYRQGVEQILADHERHVFEIRWARKDGSKIPMELNAVLLPNDRVYGSCRDISERKLAERKLRESEEYFRLILDKALDAVIGIDGNGLIVEWNAEAERIFGYRREVAIGRELAGLIIPEPYRERHRTGMGRFMQTRESKMLGTRIEISALRNDGAEFPVELSVVPVPRGEAMFFSGFLRDISERKQGEAQLKLLSDRLMLATEAAGMGVWDFDVVNNVLVWDERQYQLYGIHREDFSGAYQAWEMCVHPDDLEKTNVQVREALAGMRNLDIEFRVIRPADGNIRYIGGRAIVQRDQRGAAQRMIGVNWDITESKMSEAKIHQLAFYDALTNLPNRRLLQDRLQQAFSVSARNSQHGAVMFLDLDHFKTLNDTKGHDIGDLLLLEVARRVQLCVRDGDTVSRLGGDEFVVVLETLSETAHEAATQAELVAEKIRAALNQPYQLKEHLYHTTPSIGIVLFMGYQDSLDDLLKHADTAMYQAKTAGRNTIRFYDPAMQAALEARTVLEDELRSALEKRQFHLHYQIQVDSLRRPLGAEVLLRWEHPERGMVSPAEFIPLTEDTGLIVPIGLWVLQTACAQLKAWQHEVLMRDLTLAVNVSAKQFRQADFVAQVQHVLLESGAKPSHLKLELTESTVLENVEDTIAKMRALKLLGVSFSMDDFGTGYSSLQYLKRLPLDQIKIDQSFVRDIASDPNDAAIVQTIIAMTEVLGLNVIAEGVETEAQHVYLDQHGCHAFQGYLFSKPVTVEQFEGLLQQEYKRPR